MRVLYELYSLRTFNSLGYVIFAKMLYSSAFML